jgi:toxin ParE1/3/4
LQIKWLDLAAHDLEKIEQYIARDNPDAALRVVLQIVESVGQLAEHPMMGRVGRVRGTRELIITGTPYLVPYRVKNNESVEILRVFHRAKKWPDNF